MRPLQQTFFPRETAMRARNRGQTQTGLVKMCQPMSLSSFVGKSMLCGVLFAIPALTFSAPNFHTNSGEFSIAGPLPGTQDFPHLSVGPYGGYLVWQDNSAPQGLTINALPLDGGLSRIPTAFRVNQSRVGDHESPRV